MKSRPRKRLSLSGSEALTHYMVAVLPLVFGLLFLVAALGGKMDNERLWIIPLFTVAALLWKLQYDRLYFREYVMEYDEEQFQEAVRRTNEDIGWRIDRNARNLFRASRRGSSETITILKYRNRLLINSISSTQGRGSSPVSFGRNNNNIAYFLAHLADVVNNRPQTSKVHVTEKALLSIKRIMTIVFAFFIGAFAIYILQWLTVWAFLIGIPMLTLALFYLYAELRELLSRRV